MGRRGWRVNMAKKPQIKNLHSRRYWRKNVNNFFSLFCSIRPRLLAEFGLLWLISHSVVLLLAWQRAAGLRRMLTLISRTVSMASIAFVKTFQWGHWQVVVKRAKKHSWRVGLSHCILFSNCWQGWRKKDFCWMFTQECLFHTDPSCFQMPDSF